MVAMLVRNFGLTRLACLIGIAYVTGCVSPLKSDDPITRINAVEKISSQDALFMVAMNVGQNFQAEQYPDDVRVAAVKRISEVSYLLKCAVWHDDELHELGYMGGRHRSVVNPGEVVHRAALERLCDKAIFVEIPEAVNGIDYDERGREAINRLLVRVAKQQRDQTALCEFVVASRSAGLKIYPDAVSSAIESMDGSNQACVVRVFRCLFLSKGADCATKPAEWGWSLLDKIENPSDECIVEMARVGYGSRIDDGGENRPEIDRIAKAKFTDDVWSKCYREDLFKGYPRSKMVENIKTSEGMAKFLVAVRKMNVDDVGVAFVRIKDADMLARIKRDCYLKVVAEKAELLHFALTYQQRLKEISMMNSKVERALAANEFRTLMKEAEIDEEKKRKLSVLLVKWIDVGIDQIISEADVLADVTFPVAGFYPGMKSDEAKLLFEYRYPEEEISWSVDAKGVIERINFGMTFLAKIYKFEANTWGDWIDAFSRKTGRRFESDELKDEKKPIGGRGTIVRVSQKIWRCQDRRKDLTITYFGDKQVQEIEPEASGFVESVFKIARGVTGGDIVKEVVLEGARHWANKGWEAEIGGYPGMMRVERGTVGPGGTRKIQQPTSKSGLERTADSVKDTWDAMKDAAPAVENFMNNLLN